MSDLKERIKEDLWWEIKEYNKGLKVQDLDQGSLLILLKDAYEMGFDDGFYEGKECDCE